MGNVSTNDKMCPLTRQTCSGGKGAFWCNWGGDCSVPLLAAMFADSEICRTYFPECEVKDCDD